MRNKTFSEKRKYYEAYELWNEIIVTDKIEKSVFSFVCNEYMYGASYK